MEVVIEDTNGKGFTEELARFYLSLAVYEQTWWSEFYYIVIYTVIVCNHTNVYLQGTFIPGPIEYICIYGV